MAKSPCIGCEFELADKNNPTCRECDRRVEYVALIAGGDMEKTEEREERKEDRKKTDIEHRTSNIEHVSRHSIAKPDRMKKQTPVIPAKAGIQKKREYHKSKVCVICHDSGKKILNKRSQTCGACYQAWNTGKIEHPTLGKFKPSLSKSKITKRKKTEPRGQKSKARYQKIEEILGREGPIITLNLDNYPRIKNQINFLADKYLVNSEHVIIGLLGEALASRARLSPCMRTVAAGRDASPGEERP